MIIDYLLIDWACWPCGLTALAVCKKVKLKMSIFRRIQAINVSLLANICVLYHKKGQNRVKTKIMS